MTQPELSTLIQAVADELRGELRNMIIQPLLEENAHLKSLCEGYSRDSQWETAFSELSEELTNAQLLIQQQRELLRRCMVDMQRITGECPIDFHSRIVEIQRAVDARGPIAV